MLPPVQAMPTLPAPREQSQVRRDPEGAPSPSVLFPLTGLRVDRVMELARRHLSMDVALISQIDSGKLHFRAVHGDAQSFGLRAGGTEALETTYCNLMVRGEIPQVIPDSSADSRVSGLGMTTSTGTRSYVGVPLRYSDGTLYGTFCCLGRDAAPLLRERDAAFMAMIAELLTEDLDAQRELDALRDTVTDVIRHERLTIALQPITDLTTGRCLGLEALSRFDAGAPDVVFAQAESVGLGIDLERLAARKALSLLPLLGPERYLAVNLTPTAVDVLVVAAAGLPHHALHRLVLEITEHTSVPDYARLRERLAPLRERGLRVAIDDAGAGFASLQHIAELQPDIIKMDRSLVDGLARNKTRRSIVTGFVLLALDCDASLVAEGVETAEDLAVLASLGVDAAQGYLIARPSADRGDLAKWLASPDMLVGLR